MLLFARLKIRLDKRKIALNRAPLIPSDVVRIVNLCCVVAFSWQVNFRCQLRERNGAEFKERKMDGGGWEYIVALCVTYNIHIKNGSRVDMDGKYANILFCARLCATDFWRRALISFHLLLLVLAWESGLFGSAASCGRVSFPNGFFCFSSSFLLYVSKKKNIYIK